jgi:glycyl-tRNA synthetase beta chain
MYWTGKGGPFDSSVRSAGWSLCSATRLCRSRSPACRPATRRADTDLLGKPEVEVTIDNFAEQLHANGVVLSATQRRAMIEAGLGPNVQRDDALLNTLVYLTEHPSTIRGSFDRKVPRVAEGDSQHGDAASPALLLGGTGRRPTGPEFVAVMNTKADPEGLVRLGNERVLRARFNDARFFWDVDMRRKLADRRSDLKNVTFQAKLGSYYDKTERVVSLAADSADGGRERGD